MRTISGAKEVRAAFYTYNKDNSLTLRYNKTDHSATYYTYDPNGALTYMFDSVEGSTYITYEANQLIKSITPPTGTPWQFYYDGQLNRYRIDKGELGTRYVLWDGLNCLEERDSSGNLKVRYSYAYSPIYGIGSCTEVYLADSDTTYTLAMDHRGTVNAVIDTSGGIVASRRYNAFGEIVQHSGTWPTELGYQTNWMEIVVGGRRWCTSKFRVFDPATGRFTQRDFS